MLTPENEVLKFDEEGNKKARRLIGTSSGSEACESPLSVLFAGAC